MASLARTPTGTASRAERLAQELRYALRNVPRNEVRKCVTRLPGALVEGLTRRTQRAAWWARLAATAVARKTGEGFHSVRSGRGMEFARATGEEAMVLLEEVGSVAAGIAKRVPTWCHALATTPEQVLPEAVGGVLGALIGSGGFDADGGLPDLDLLAGIGYHRSIVTHSIFIGAAAESVLVSLDGLVLLTYRHLPPEHDPLWDLLNDWASRTSTAAKLGTSVGIAYHLGVDGTLQVAALKGLPFSAPIEAHQAILVGNTVMEAGDFKKVRRSDSGP